MACGGALSPLMLTAGSGLIQNIGLGVSPTLVSNLGSFEGLGVTSQFSDIVSSASGVLGGSTLDSLRTLGADIFPALTNSIPGDFTSALSLIAPGGVADGGLTGLISSTASGIMGDGDLSKFGQIFTSAEGFLSQANQFINSSLNIDSLSTTFGSLTGGMDNLITGAFSQVTQSFGEFGSDLSKLGNLINLDDLPNLGSPSALVKQLATVGGVVPAVENVLRDVGLSSAQLINVASGNFTGLSDVGNKILYDGMTRIAGKELEQVKSILGVTTPGIANMADLLNPSKILPNSYTTLTMPTPDGLKGIYTTANAVNQNLEKFLIDPNAPAYTGDDPIVRARLGLPPLDSQGTLTA